MKIIKNSLILVLVVSMMVAFTGCKGKEKDESTSDTKANAETNTQDDNTSDLEELSGSVTISGSTSVEKIGNAVAEEFMALYPSVEITYEGIGSSGGVKNANNGVTQIGTASRNLKEEEKSWGLTEVAIAYDGVAVITHPDNNLKGLTKDQVKAIFKGEITNWSDVGGKDEEIVVVSREDGSGTRGAFEEIVDFEDALTSKALIADGNGNVQTTVANNPKSIGYVSFTYINETVSALLIDDVEPTAEKVVEGLYSISRPFLMIYHEDNMTKETKAFMEFILSSEGQDIVEEKGGIKVK
ncbi:MAG: phosphate ABC transporter substrate-binding protein [Vallitalea sp.]|jgi:phosphate transport system substrate-binding protein|nr:phosphate ABC transporter substrate-binding protein [Vallitalea sp.]